MSLGTEQRIRDTALDLVFTDVATDFTIGDICRRSGVTRTTIYRPWPKGHDLQVDTIAGHIGQLPAPDTGALRFDLGTLFRRVMSMPDITVKRRMVLGVMQAATDDHTCARRSTPSHDNDRFCPQRAPTRSRAPSSQTKSSSFTQLSPSKNRPSTDVWFAETPARKTALDAILCLLIAGLCRPHEPPRARPRRSIRARRGPH